MTLRAEYTLHLSEFTEFLHAPIWKEQEGTSLSVLSMLARLDIDPWAEAARLAALPREAATASLAAIVARLPWSAQDPDPTAIAGRLVDLLPRPGTTPPQVRERGRLRDRAGDVRLWLVIALLVTLVGLMAAGPVP